MVWGVHVDKSCFRLGSFLATCTELREPRPCSDLTRHIDSVNLSERVYSWEPYLGKAVIGGHKADVIVLCCKPRQAPVEKSNLRQWIVYPKASELGRWLQARCSKERKLGRLGNSHLFGDTAMCLVARSTKGGL